jgi:hypothetical protein
LTTRSRTTFNKRQKEQARQEKQRAKAQRKLQRKLEHQSDTTEAIFAPDSVPDHPNENVAPDSQSQPQMPPSRQF